MHVSKQPFILTVTYELHQSLTSNAMLNAVFQMQNQKCKQWPYKDADLCELIVAMITSKKTTNSDAWGTI